MNFNQHSNLEGLHAFLGGSKYSWINYTDDKLADTYKNYLAKERGTRLHAYACESILLKQKLPRNNLTLNMFVNDAIGFHMTPEQPLMYSMNCFGTADAISFRNNKLRIHDLKTGETPTHMEQLMIYAALFCLEYNQKPGMIEIELRIYQNNQVTIFEPKADDILPIMDKIVAFDKLITKIQEEEK